MQLSNRTALIIVGSKLKSPLSHIESLWFSRYIFKFSPCGQHFLKRDDGVATGCFLYFSRWEQSAGSNGLSTGLWTGTEVANLAPDIVAASVEYVWGTTSVECIEASRTSIEVLLNVSSWKILSKAKYIIENAKIPKLVFFENKYFEYFLLWVVWSLRTVIYSAYLCGGVKKRL